MRDGYYMLVGVERLAKIFSVLNKLIHVLDTSPHLRDSPQASHPSALTPRPRKMSPLTFRDMHYLRMPVATSGPQSLHVWSSQLAPWLGAQVRHTATAGYDTARSSTS